MIHPADGQCHVRTIVSLSEGKRGLALAAFLKTFSTHFITAVWLLTSSGIDPADVQLAR